MEALKRPLFMEYKENQPFNENHLRSCPLLDNYGKLAEMVENSNANSTEMLNPEDVNNLCNKCKQVATDWEVAADRICTSKIKVAILSYLFCSYNIFCFNIV